jgi:hypothetical protein
MKRLWLITLFVLVPLSIVVAEEEQEKVEYQIGIPHYIVEAYIINDDPLKCLVPLDYIAIAKEVAVVPFVTEGNRRFMESFGIAPDNLQVVLECIICTCEDHEGNRVQVINGLDQNGVMQLLWTNPNVLLEEDSQ